VGGRHVSADGKTGTLWEKINAQTNQWARYSEIDGSADFPTDVAPQYRNKGFHLGNWYSTYDWVGNDGYNNFATWVG
jgi:hypothetical protein